MHHLFLVFLPFLAGTTIHPSSYSCFYSAFCSAGLFSASLWSTFFLSSVGFWAIRAGLCSTGFFYSALCSAGLFSAAFDSTLRGFCSTFCSAGLCSTGLLWMTVLCSPVFGFTYSCLTSVVLTCLPSILTSCLCYADFCSTGLTGLCSNGLWSTGVCSAGLC